jgi:hypothetical protein
MRSEVEADLLAIPSEAEKVVLFNRHRLVVQSLGDELAKATPEAIQQVVACSSNAWKPGTAKLSGGFPRGQRSRSSTPRCHHRGAPGRRQTSWRDASGRGSTGGSARHMHRAGSGEWRNTQDPLAWYAPFV